MRAIKRVRARKPVDEIMYKPIADFRDYINRENLTSEHLWIPMGVDANNKLIEVDLIQTPNIWVRGKTGTGKTEWLRSAVKSLLWRYSEEDVVVNVIAADCIDKYAIKGDWGSVVEFLKSFTETFDGCRLFLNSVAKEIEKITKESN